MNELIDPDWAWAEYSPSAQSPWDTRMAAHLFRRAGFGATDQELKAAVEQRPSELVDSLMSARESDAFLRDMKSLAGAAVATGNVKQLSAWWTYRMLSTPTQLLEKMTLFWHGHFATGGEKVKDAELMLTQNECLRRFSLGDFSKMLLEISRDPAMLIYLDSATNRKAHPNENYAREIMELFCLGEGHYTETDIRELARCFTGWEIRRGEFKFNHYQHDTGTKSILGKTGAFAGEDGVAIVLEQNSAPEFIASKLVRFFVMDEPQPDKTLVSPLATLLRQSDMLLAPVIKCILSSNLFFSPHSIGRKVRSPVEFAVGLLRCLEGSTNSFSLAESMDALGQGLLFPPSVKGWDGGRTWINSSTLLGRSNLIRTLLTGDKTRFAKQSLEDYFKATGLDKPRLVIDHLERLLFAVPIASAAKDRVESLMKSDNDSSFVDGIHALCTLPEFQLG